MTIGTDPSSAARRIRRPQLPINRDCVSGEANSKKNVSLSATTATTAAGSSSSSLSTSLRQCLWKLFVGRTCINNNATAPKRRNGRSGTFSVVVRRMVLVLFFLSVYVSVYQQLDEIERQNDLGYEHQREHDHHHQQQQQQQIPEISVVETRSNGNKKINNNTLAHYLTVANSGDAAPVSTSLGNARKGREHILSILEDAGIDEFDAEDVLHLPLWSSVSELYSNTKSNSSGSLGKQSESELGNGGPVIIGLEGCAAFRERVPARDRFLGVAGNFNSGTTAFGISLQKNCRFSEHPSSKNFVVRRKRNVVFASNVNGMLSQVPWAKHKTAEYRHGDHTILPPSMEYSFIDHDRVLPIVLVRDPFYWMQSMCKEGYGVRWDHDSNHHCPNLIPNEFDRKRFPPKPPAATATDGSVGLSPIPVWMGANPTVGPTWPSLIHYWNAWYESYYSNSNSRAKTGVDKNNPSTWPRLMIRFEDTLFYPKQVMEAVCHCGGGKLLSEPSSSSSGNKKQHQLHDYTFEEAKPDHKHQQKNNFVTAMIEYGTNATRLRNMTDADVRFAIESLNPTLMQAFGYSYPNTNTNPQQH